MRTADVTTALLLALGGLLVLWDSVRVGIRWGTDGPQSGFFPFWLAVALLLCCAAIVAQALRRADHVPFVTRQAAAPVLKVLLPALGFVAVMPFVGLYVATALYMALYMRWIGRHAWLTVATLSVGVPVITFLVFEVWFLVPLPKGPLEAWLGY